MPINTVIALIDYRPGQSAGVASIGHGELLADASRRPSSYPSC